MNRNPEPNFFPGLFMMVGFALLVTGIEWISRPAALIAAGILITAFGFFGRRGSI